VVLPFGDLIHTDENHTMADALNGRHLHIQRDITLDAPGAPTLQASLDKKY